MIDDFTEEQRREFSKVSANLILNIISPECKKRGMKLNDYHFYIDIALCARKLVLKEMTFAEVKEVLLNSFNYLGMSFKDVVSEVEKQILST